MQIKEFYSNCDILITGGTGFMGKVLIEKLLRSCPGVNNIYILMRSSKGKNIHTRLNDMLNLPLFDKIKEKHPGMAEEKLVPVAGDLTDIRLGLRDADYEVLMRNVSIVFHVAAAVRFDEPFREAVIKNVRGTREIVRLAKQMKFLKVFLHVSTTYSNCNRIYADEKVYNSPISWQDAISIAEYIDPTISEVCTKKLLGLFPNTYTFAKLLAEQIIHEEANNNNMPMVIFRPSVVIATAKEPVKGWIDNFNGPIGFMVACGKGVTNTVLSNPDLMIDFMPVDISIKAMIVAAYHRGIHNSVSDKNITVYNSAIVDKSLKNKDLSQYSVKYSMLYPFDEILWRPRVIVTTSKLLFYTLIIIQQVLPALILDNIIKAFNIPQTMNLVNLQRKIFIAQMALSYFTTQAWTFTNTNFLDLINNVPENEKQEFDCSINLLNNEQIFKNCLIGSQKYLLKSNPKLKKQAIKQLNKIIWFDRFLRTSFFVLIVWCILKSNILPIFNYKLINS